MNVTLRLPAGKRDAIFFRPVTPPERAIRQIVFFAGFFAFMAWTGLKLLPVRLLGLVAPGAACRLARRMIVTWNRRVVRWAQLAAGVDLVIEGSPPAGTGYVIASSHQSIVDIPLVLATFGAQNPLFVSKNALKWGVPNISPAARRARHAFVSRRRGDPRQFGELARLGAVLEPERASVVIFPEGTRSRDGTLGAFKAGGTVALLRSATAARLVPVAIDGTWRVADLRSLLARFAGVRIRMRIGAPIELTPAERADDAALRAAVERCREFCASALAEWRK